MRRILNLFIISCSLLGIMDAGYITWEKIQGSFPVCNPMFQCEEVLSSSWSSIGPVPLSVLGLGFYLIFFGLAVYLYLGGQMLKIGPRQVALTKLMQIWSLVGALFSLYLITVMGVILQAWCLYCLISAVNCYVLLALAVSLHKLHIGGEV